MNLLVVLFGIAFLLWGLLLARYASLAVAGLAVVLTGACFGPPFFAIEGPIQISADRLLWGLLMILFIVHWRLGWTAVQSFQRSDWVVLLLLGWLLVGSQRGGAVPDGSSPLARWLFYFALPAGIYAVARWAAVRRHELRGVLNVLIGFTVYVSVIAICEWRGWYGLVFPRYIADPTLSEFFGRARGPLLNPAANGVLLTAGLGLVLIRGVQAERLGKILYGLLGGLVCLAVYGTLTRGVWLGALLAIAAVAAFYAPRWVRVLGLAAAVLLAASLALGLKDQLLRLKRDKALSAAAAEKSLELRPLLGILAWEMFQDHPLAGVGYGHYFEHVPPYYQDTSYDLPLEAARGYMQHNVFLSLLVDAGLVGATLFSLLLLTWASQSIRLAGDKRGFSERQQLGMLTMTALIGYGFNGLFQDVSVMPMVHLFLFYLAGLTAGVAQHGLPQEEATWEAKPAPPAASGREQRPTREGWGGPRHPSPLSS